MQENRPTDGPLPSPETLSGPYRPDRSSHQLLEFSFQRMALSLRGLRAVLRVARTIADLAGRPTTGASHLAEALQYRSRLTGEGEEP